MTFDGVEFVRRLSLHIPPPGFTKIRHYGILGNNRRAKAIPLAREALAREVPGASGRCSGKARAHAQGRAFGVPGMWQ